MKEKTQLKTWLLFLFLFGVFAISTGATAAVTVTPNVSGYARDSVTGGYLNNRAGDGQRLFDQAARSYGGTGTFSAGGKELSVPAKIPLASTAVSAAKAGMRLNPTSLAATAAAGWLVDQGLEWMDDQKQWVKGDGQGTINESSVPVSQLANGNICANTHSGQLPNMTNCYLIMGAGSSESEVGGCPFVAETPADGNPYNDYMTLYQPKNPFPSGCSLFNPNLLPFPDTAWDALPDPIPTVGPELPSAPYMQPKGVPVDAPRYDFAPFNTPTGQPYKKPDGSTVQPNVTVSANATSVTYNTYNTTIINQAGEPVVDAPPIDVSADEVKDECADHPDRVGCQDLGTDDFRLEKETVTMVYAPEPSPISGSCPAPISLPNGGSLSWEPACNAMVTIKSIVLALAGMMTAFMVIGAMRS